MFLYKEGRLHRGGISLAIPEGIMLASGEDFDWLSFCDPDVSWTIELSTIEHDIDNGFWGDTDEEDILAMDIHPVEIPGIHGEQALWNGTRDFYHEVRIEMDRDDEEIQLLVIMLHMRAKKKSDAARIKGLVKNHPVMKQVLDSLRAESEDQ